MVVKVSLNVLKKENNFSKIFFTSFLIFLFLFIFPSLAETDEIGELLANENYTTIVVTLPELLYKPEAWNKVYSNVEEINNLYYLKASATSPPDYCKTLLELIKEKYGLICEFPDYEPVADVNKDGKVDIFDITTFSSNYNDEWCYEKIIETESPCSVKKLASIEFSNKSIPEIAVEFNGTVYINSPNYSYSKIILPKENYENITEVFESLGFVVKKGILLELLIDKSRATINLPCCRLSDKYTFTGQGRKIAIIDTGIDDSHPDFGGLYGTPGSKIKFWNDTVNHILNPYDSDGHGTHVASIAAGSGAALNGAYKGVAYKADLMVWKACRTIGCEPFNLATAINQVVDHSPDVISMSLGTISTNLCSGNVTGEERELYDAVNRALNNNIPIVAAAGNYGPEPSTVMFPACLENVIAVGSTYKTRSSSYFEKGEYSILHVIIQVWDSGMINLLQNYDFQYRSGKDKMPTDVINILQPPQRDVVIQVLAEGEHNWTDWVCADHSEWDPGDGGKGDLYWDWSESFSTNNSIAVEISSEPFISEGSCWIIGKQHEYRYTRQDIGVNIFEVTGANAGKIVAYESSRGPAPQNPNLIKPLVTAPGVEICAAKSSDATFDDSYFTCYNNKYISMSGTSMATPHVAGLVALLKEQNPSLTISQIINALTYADQGIPENPDNNEGYGRINVHNALTALGIDVSCLFEKDWLSTCGAVTSYGASGPPGPPKIR